MQRTMRRRLATLLAVTAALAVLAAGEAGAQGSDPGDRPDPAAEAREAMSRLAYLAGDWQGEGWMEYGGARRPFRGSERVHSKLDGLVLLVEGDFYARVPGVEGEVPVHQTLGVISYDADEDVYRFHSWLSRGSSGERELTLREDGWQWEIQSPGGTIRYVMTRTAENEWFEIGERSEDGENWTQFFEMKLVRQSPAEAEERSQS